MTTRLLFFHPIMGVIYTGGIDGTFFNSSGVFGEAYGRGKGFVYEGGIRVPMIASWQDTSKLAARLIWFLHNMTY